MKSFMTDAQWQYWNEGLDFYPDNLCFCPYEVGSEAYAYFEDGWWFADNEQ